MAVLLAFGTTYRVMAGRNPTTNDLMELGPVTAVAILTILVFSSFLVETSNRRQDLGVKGIAAKVILSSILSLVIGALCYPTIFFTFAGGVLLFSLIVAGVFRFIYYAGFHSFLRQAGLGHRILILGAGAEASSFGKLVDKTGGSFVLAGYLRCGNEPDRVPAERILTSTEGLQVVALAEKCDKIVVSLSERRGMLPLREIMACKVRGVDVVDAPTFYEQVTGKLLLERITPSWFIFSDGFRVSPRRRVTKRLLDVASSVLGLVLTVPLLPFVALAIKMDSPGPAFFRQKRVGQGEKLFTLYKFRTMRADAESSTGAVWAKENDPRVTRLGRVLRKCRIDELPQLYNVLRGEMSMVGPRPERQEFVEKLKEIIPYYSERHVVKPGVTGWAQVRYPYGASAGDTVEKLRYDLYYVKNLSMVLDLAIMIETMGVVVLGRGSR
ncbi:TIGR03013 family PEP-CTERM/XrtA system glycosyltransferase [Geomonas sp. Red875]|uniref:TIGR03013 family PEP-CTERM/XrtA system glycosyltransferase n=2 Tax=Geomesophilobacter sediminis TaxID=2798584 RepID=A0A8J7M1V3_9BACT|nr:TIGR03013 family PEP-CTERM/XrtA system glycosyltransferase [Geomesophilobacter sediminis]